MPGKKCAHTSSSAWKATSLFADYFSKCFRPEAFHRLSDGSLHRYDQAVAAFLDFAGERVRLGGVDDATLDKFADSAPPGRCPHWRRTLAGTIRQVVLSWNQNACSLPKPRVAELPPPKHGTVRFYFRAIYLPTAMVDAKAQSINQATATLRELYLHLGRDLRLNEQTEALAASFFRAQLDRGLSPATVNRKRAEWFAVMNHAFERGAAKYSPRVKKLKENRDPPDAWSIDESKDILSAAATFRLGKCYNDIPCPLWWRALFLVGFQTALRKGSLLGLRLSDYDRKTGVLLSRGERSKTRVGRKFKLGPDARAAVDLILHPSRELLFDTSYSSNVIGLHMGKLLEAARIEPSRRKILNQFHKLRRTSYTAVAGLAGVGAAADLCGHSTRYLADRYLDPEKLGACEVGLVLPQLESLTSAAG